LLEPRKTSLSRVPEDGQRAALATAEDQVLPAVGIQVKPACARATLAEPSRQERLAGEVVEGRFVMAVIEQAAHVFEKRRCRNRCWLGR